jgi:hypothetical protein
MIASASDFLIIDPLPIFSSSISFPSSRHRITFASSHHRISFLSPPHRAVIPSAHPNCRSSMVSFSLKKLTRNFFFSLIEFMLSPSLFV